MITLKNLSKSYRSGSCETKVLKEITLQIGESGLVFLTGESGSGKSTLLNLIGGLDTPSSGNYYFNENDISSLGEKEWSGLRQREFGIIFQSYNLIEHLSVRENVTLNLIVENLTQSQKIERVKEVLMQVGMWEYRDYLPNQLSGGQKQRVAVARSLVNNPSIILADEPTGALDSTNSQQIMNLLKEIAQQGKLVLLVTHSQDYNGMADRLIHLEDGRIKEDSCSKRITHSNETGKKIVRGKSLGLSTLFKMSYHNTFSKKKRAILTALGTAIGITGLLLIAFLSSGVNHYVESEFGTYQSNEVLMVNKTNRHLFSQKEQMNFSKMSGVKTAYKDYFFAVNMKNKNKMMVSTAYSLANKKDQIIYKQSNLLKGRFPTNKGEVMIPENMAKELFSSGKNALSQQVEITAQLMASEKLMPTYLTQAKIVGVTKEKILDQLNVVYFSQSLAADMVDSSGETENQTNNMLLLMDSSKQTEKLAQQLRKNKALQVVTPKEDIEIGKQYTTIIFVFLGLIAGISLIVAAIMITIVIYVSVLERKKEIGVLKSLGVRVKDVRKIFLIEGALVGTLGGTLGVVFSILLGVLGNSLLQQKLDISDPLLQFNWQSMMTAVVFSLLLGMCVSWLPAQKASKKKVVEALSQ